MYTEPTPEDARFLNRLAWLGAGVSLLLSLVPWLQGDGINRDGVLYLFAAQAIREQGLVESLAVYGWPFYSLLIAGLASLGLELEQAGRLLGALCFAGLTHQFLRCLAFLAPDRLAGLLGLGLILLLPQLNGIRSELVRDTGMLWFAFAALHGLMHFRQHKRWPAWVLSLLAAGVAGLFRPEALLLALAPLGYGLKHWLGHHALRWLTAAVALIGLGLALASTELPDVTATKLVELSWYYASPVDSLHNWADKLGQVLPAMSQEFGYELALATLALIFGATLLKVLTPIPLLAWFATRRLPPPRRTWPVWLFAAILSVPILIYTARWMFLSDRYVLAIALFLLLLAPARLLVWCHAPGRRTWRYGLLALAGLLLVYSNLGKLTPSNRPLREAGLWLRQEAQGQLWVNHSVLAYYAGINSGERHRTDYWKTPPAQPTPWIALVLNPRDGAVRLQELESRGYTLVRRFDGDKRSVYVLKAAAQP